MESILYVHTHTVKFFCCMTDGRRVRVDGTPLSG